MKFHVEVGAALTAALFSSVALDAAAQVPSIPGAAAEADLPPSAASSPPSASEPPAVVTPASTAAATDSPAPPPPSEADAAPYPATYPHPRYAEVSGFGAQPRPRVAVPTFESSCCRWSVRYDPFDLLARRVTLAAEIALGDLPLSLEVTPKYIFDSAAEALDERGFDIGANLAWYPGGRALRGLWVKAHAEYESFRATLTRDGGAGPIGKPNPSVCDADSATGTCSRNVKSAIVGLLVGSTQVFGADGGFAVSGGIGIGAALASGVDLSVIPCSAEDVADGHPSCTAAESASATGVGFRYYDDASRIRLLGTMSLGAVF